jgi:Uma2 family endonuclease
MASIPPSTHSANPQHGEPAWDVALLFPSQGHWSEGEYLDLTDSTNRLIEFTDGRLEFLTMPTLEHQKILRFLFRLLDSFALSLQVGEVFFAPLRVYIRPGKYREPDIVFKFLEGHSKSGPRYYEGADLVMEVVSDDAESNKRDYETKVLDYAEAGIPEYWIVDPQKKQITVLTLVETSYQTAGVYQEGAVAESKLLPDFTVNVSEVFAAAKA